MKSIWVAAVDCITTIIHCFAAICDGNKVVELLWIYGNIIEIECHLECQIGIVNAKKFTIYGISDLTLIGFALPLPLLLLDIICHCVIFVLHLIPSEKTWKFIEILSRSIIVVIDLLCFSPSLFFAIYLFSLIFF